MKKGKKTWFALLLAVGLIASGASYYAFSANMVEVVVANKTLQGNTEITASMLSTKKVDKESLPDNYLTADLMNDMVGKYTNIGITQGSVFTEGNVATENSKKAAVIPKDKTLLSIKIDSLPQGVVAGDNVNLLVGINMESQGKVVMTFQKVKVTNTYVDVDGSVKGLEVEVTPSQAQKIQYAQINGELSVSLLPLGYEEEELPIVNQDEITGYTNETDSNNSSNEQNQESNNEQNQESNNNVEVVEVN